MKPFRPSDRFLIKRFLKLLIALSLILATPGQDFYLYAGNSAKEIAKPASRGGFRPGPIGGFITPPGIGVQQIDPFIHILDTNEDQQALGAEQFIDVPVAATPNDSVEITPVPLEAGGQPSRAIRPANVDTPDFSDRELKDRGPGRYRTLKTASKAAGRGKDGGWTELLNQQQAPAASSSEAALEMPTSAVLPQPAATLIWPSGGVAHHNGRYDRSNDPLERMPERANLRGPLEDPTGSSSQRDVRRHQGSAPRGNPGARRMIFIRSRRPVRTPQSSGLRLQSVRIKRSPSMHRSMIQSDERIWQKPPKPKENRKPEIKAKAPTSPLAKRKEIKKKPTKKVKIPQAKITQSPETAQQKYPSLVQIYQRLEEKLPSLDTALSKPLQLRLSSIGRRIGKIAKFLNLAVDQELASHRANILPDISKLEKQLQNWELSYQKAVQEAKAQTLAQKQAADPLSVMPTPEQQSPKPSTTVQHSAKLAKKLPSLGLYLVWTEAEAYIDVLDDPYLKFEIWTHLWDAQRRAGQEKLAVKTMGRAIANAKRDGTRWHLAKALTALSEKYHLSATSIDGRLEKDKKLTRLERERLIEERVNKQNSAETCLNQALKAAIDPTKEDERTISPLVQAAVEQLNKGTYGKVGKIIKRLDNKPYDQILVLLHLMDAQRRAGHHERMVRTLQKAIKIAQKKVTNRQLIRLLSKLSEETGVPQENTIRLTNKIPLYLYQIQELLIPQPQKIQRNPLLSTAIGQINDENFGKALETIKKMNDKPFEQVLAYLAAAEKAAELGRAANDFYEEAERTAKSCSPDKKLEVISAIAISKEKTGQPYDDLMATLSRAIDSSITRQPTPGGPWEEDMAKEATSKLAVNTIAYDEDMEQAYTYSKQRATWRIDTFKRLGLENPMRAGYFHWKIYEKFSSREYEAYLKELGKKLSNLRAIPRSYGPYFFWILGQRHYPTGSNLRPLVLISQGGHASYAHVGLFYADTLEEVNIAGASLWVKTAPSLLSVDGHKVFSRNSNLFEDEQGIVFYMISPPQKWREKESEQEALAKGVIPLLRDIGHPPFMDSGIHLFEDILSAGHLHPAAIYEPFIRAVALNQSFVEMRREAIAYWKYILAGQYDLLAKFVSQLPLEEEKLLRFVADSVDDQKEDASWRLRRSAVGLMIPDIKPDSNFFRILNQEFNAAYNSLRNLDAILLSGQSRVDIILAFLRSGDLARARLISEQYPVREESPLLNLAQHIQFIVEELATAKEWNRALEIGRFGIELLQPFSFPNVAKAARDLEAQIFLIDGQRHAETGPSGTKFIM